MCEMIDEKCFGKFRALIWVIHGEPEREKKKKLREWIKLVAFEERGITIEPINQIASHR